MWAFKKIIPDTTYCIIVWENCLVARFKEIENLCIKVDRFILRVPPSILDSEVLSYVKCQDLRYLYKGRPALEFLRLNCRILTNGFA